MQEPTVRQPKDRGSGRAPSLPRGAHEPRGGRKLVSPAGRCTLLVLLAVAAAFLVSCEGCNPGDAPGPLLAKRTSRKSVSLWIIDTRGKVHIGPDPYGSDPFYSVTKPVSREDFATFTSRVRQSPYVVPPPVLRDLRTLVTAAHREPRVNTRSCPNCSTSTVYVAYARDEQNGRFWPFELRTGPLERPKNLLGPATLELSRWMKETEVHFDASLQE